MAIMNKLEQVIEAIKQKRDSFFILEHNEVEEMRYMFGTSTNVIKYLEKRSGVSSSAVSCFPNEPEFYHETEINFGGSLITFRTYF
jgi:hypothetical protein